MQKRGLPVLRRKYSQEKKYYEMLNKYKEKILNLNFKHPDRELNFTVVD